jgi:hypothetical protein
MARGRMISKSLSTSEKFGGLVSLGTLAEFAQLLYPLLVVHSDDFGRLQGDPYTVKLICLPSSPRTLEDFGAALVHLDAVGLIHWYTAEDKRYIEIRNFEWHQQGLHKRTRSQFPDIPGKPRKVSVFPSEGRKELKEGRKEGTTPKPPSNGRGPHRPAAQPLTRKETDAAAKVRDRMHGGCPHDPRCRAYDACVNRLAYERRQKAASS